MTRILGLGDNTIDTYVDRGTQYPGGNAVNVAAMMARLGADAAYLGCVGDDEGGQLLRKSLAAERVDISHTRTRAGSNARVFVNHINGDRKFFGSTPGVRTDYRWKHRDFDYMASFDHIHISFDSAVEHILPEIKNAQRSISLDASTKWSQEYLRQVLPHIRFAFLSASHLADTAAVTLAEECLALGPEAVIVTRGSSGALGLNSNGPVYQPALPANVVDTLGAGDGFIAGFLTGILANASFPAALTQGADFASQVCGWDGGFGHGIPWRDASLSLPPKNGREDVELQ